MFLGEWGQGDHVVLERWFSNIHQWRDKSLYKKYMVFLSEEGVLSTIALFMMVSLLHPYGLDPRVLEWITKLNCMSLVCSQVLDPNKNTKLSNKLKSVALEEWLSSWSECVKVVVVNVDGLFDVTLGNSRQVPSILSSITNLRHYRGTS